MAETQEYISHVDRFFGNGEHRFSLHDKGKRPDPWGLVRELEKQFEMGPPKMYFAFCQGTFTASLARETIRLGLIGGGKTPSEAHSLVQQYFDRDPLTEHVPLCIDLWSALLFGRKVDEPTELAVEEAATPPSEADE